MGKSDKRWDISCTESCLRSQLKEAASKADKLVADCTGAFYIAELEAQLASFKVVSAKRDALSVKLANSKSDVKRMAGEIQTIDRYRDNGQDS
jgi:hypothetical protein